MTATSASVPLPTEECQIPEIIEEKRKDADGKIVTTKYIKGKLLGKVIIVVESLMVIL